MPRNVKREAASRRKPRHQRMAKNQFEHPHTKPNQNEPANKQGKERKDCEKNKVLGKEHATLKKTKKTEIRVVRGGCDPPEGKSHKRRGILGNLTENI